MGDTQACCIRMNFRYVEDAQGDGSSTCIHQAPTALRFIKSSQRRSQDPRPTRVAGIVTHISALAADMVLCVLDYHNGILDQLINCSMLPFRCDETPRLAITLNMRERTLQRWGWGKTHKRPYPIKASPLPLHRLSTDGSRPATPG